MAHVYKSIASCVCMKFTMSCGFGCAFIDRILSSSTQERKLKPGSCGLELFEHVRKGYTDHLAFLHIQHTERGNCPFNSIFKRELLNRSQINYLHNYIN